MIKETISADARRVGNNESTAWHVEQLTGAKDVDITSTKSIPANMMAAHSLAQVSHEKAQHDQPSVFKDVMAGNSPGFSGEVMILYGLAEGPWQLTRPRQSLCR